MKTSYLILPCLLIMLSCSKKNDSSPSEEELPGGILKKTETVNGITFRTYSKQEQRPYKGILVMGSGNDENNPSAGNLDGAAENDLCIKAATYGYVAAIVHYTKPPESSDWNERARILGSDYDKCIRALSDIYKVDQSKSVVGGYSYASYMLLTNNALNDNLNYSKGILAACGSTDAWKAQNFKIPVFSISCSGNNEGDYNGKELYDQIPANSPVKAKSGGITDGSCNTHCGSSWTEEMYSKMNQWLQ